MSGEGKDRYFVGVPQMPSKKKKMSYWEEQQMMHKRIRHSDEELQKFREQEYKRKGK